MAKKKWSEKNRVPKCYNRVYPLIILLSTLFLGMGYAQVNNINLTISGDLTAIIPNSVYITSAAVSGSTNGGDTTNSAVTNYSQTMVTSNVTLSTTNLNSTVSMQVSIKNGTDTIQYFDDLIASSSYYSNPNIDYTLTGVSHGDSISPNEIITTTLTFKYSDAYKNSSPSTPYTNTLESIIEYRFDDVITIEYPVTITGTPFTPTSSELHAHQGETYTLDFRSNNYFLIVTMNGTTLKENDEYTFSSSGVLSIPNVNGPITISAASKDTYSFVLDENTPTVERTVNVSSTTNVSSMDFTTLSNKIINSIIIEIPYHNNANKVYNIAVRLKINGVEQSSPISPKTLTFTARGDTTTTINFTGLNIPANSEISIVYDSSQTSTQGNQQVTIGTEKVTVSFAN